jgi:hypothetical protein
VSQTADAAASGSRPSPVVDTDRAAARDRHRVAHIDPLGLERAQQRRVAIADPQHATGVAEMRLGEEHERFGDLASGIRDRVAVRIEASDARAAARCPRAGGR